MVTFLSLHYGSGAVFYLNPCFIEHIERDMADHLTHIYCVGRVAPYKCVEQPEQIFSWLSSGVAPTPHADLWASPMGAVGSS